MKCSYIIHSKEHTCLIKGGFELGKNQAILSNKGELTSFSFDKYQIRFKTSPRLERYTKVEEYIDLIPILQNLYFDVESFLKPIEGVCIQYD